MNVRALCGTQAVKTLTSLAAMVRRDRLQVQSDAQIIGTPLQAAYAVPPAPLSPLGYRPRRALDPIAMRRRDGRERGETRWRV